MNAEQANCIYLSSILELVGCKPVKQNARDIFYHSPFRIEKTASFHVDTIKNVWYDFGEAKGGTVVDFTCYYLQTHNEDHTVADALRWLSNMYPVGNLPPSLTVIAPDKEPSLTLQGVSHLKNPALLDYLKSRGISSQLGKRYLKEAHVFNLNSGKTFFALGLSNENDGYELRNEFFKGCIAPKFISFIRGSTFPAREIHVFEGFMDFLSALEQQKCNQFEGDTIILNSVACLSQAFPYIENYTYRVVNSWLDNDRAGNTTAQTLKEFATKQGFSFRLMNNVYATHKDVNAWHMNKLGLRLI